MPALSSPDELATRSASYIGELHDIFVMHGHHYGMPDDIRALAERLDTPSGLSEELASLVRSIVLREGGAVSRTNLLEILVIATAGPQTDPADHELQQSVRQLLSFLHAALRRPWNEPPGEERLHSPEISAEEMKDQGAAEPQGFPTTEREGRANMIPFARSRAIYSRLTHMEPGRGEVHPAAPQSDPKPDAEPMLQIVESAREMSAVDVPTHDPDQEIVGAAGRNAEEVTSYSEPTIEKSPERVDAVVEEPLHGAAHADAVEQPTEVLEGHPTASAPASKPTQPSPIPVTDSVATVPPIQPIPFAFDAEPPLPSTTRSGRVAIIGGTAGAALLAAIVILAIRGNASVDVAAQPAVNSVAPGDRTAAPPVASLTQAVPFAVTAASTILPAKPSAYGPSLTSPPQSARRTRPSADDYIAPPYSNRPPTQPDVRVSNMASAENASAKPAGPVTPRPVAEPVAAPRSSYPRPYGDSDARLVGDLPLRNSGAGLSDRPSHPRVPSAVMAGNLISAPQPGYPLLAKLAHAEGQVVLEAEISRNGAVSPVRVISGPHLLRRAAEDAVRRWRYRPYVVNDHPVDVSTTVTVHFRRNR